MYFRRVCVFVRLNEGLEAMDMLKFGRPGEVNEESEISKMWTTSFRPVRPRGRSPASTQAYFFSCARYVVYVGRQDCRQPGVLLMLRARLLS